MAVLAGAVMVLVAACGGGDGDDDKGKSGEKGKDDKKASQAVVEIAPKNGADGVATEDALKVTASKGKLTSVKVADAKGNAVKGDISKDRTEWKPADHLATQTKYTVNAVAEDEEGLKAAKHATFTTVVPKNTFVGYFTPENGETVGAGMPVSINFNRPIEDRQAVEDAVKVTADPGVEVEGHWFGNQRLDFRPKTYWVSGTKVSLSLRLDGVQGADGVYGKQSKDVKFTVGRSQVSTVDAKTKKMTVERDGKVIKTIPITSGAPSNPTWNGQMVISEKLKVTRMNGATVGFTDDDGEGEYDIKDVPNAMRLSTSGTFIHGNYWLAKSSFGQVNGSHGCVGLFDQRGGRSKTTPGAWFFNNSMIGDVVIVKNSNEKTVAPDNGLNGWNMSWDEWTAPQD
ncbi:L,D-transpeptidase family protein [Streptomyces sp. A7024]|uniref:L,D-transpeptidase family protein n=1 Tax=Streptomyces coryli TaxID=1128680 RepID=A0A6G4TZV7_9ACTN|nr:Ig-like domain-containing protein [Streptomyces coryli]NGN64567.1 L,D-transpeptidase family protein [Streptomyces coryli]